MTAATCNAAAFLFSRWREKVPEADEGGATQNVVAAPTATLTRSRCAASASPASGRGGALS